MANEWHNFVLPRLSLECVRHGVINPRGLTDNELAVMLKNDMPLLIAFYEVKAEVERRKHTAEIIKFPRR